MKNFTQKFRLFKLIVTVALTLFAGTATAQTASYSVSFTHSCPPVDVSFTSTSPGATHYSWNFGNGTIVYDLSSSTYSLPYTVPGTYTITLTAINGSDSMYYSDTINIPAPPTVNFSTLDTAICPGVVVTFTNTTTDSANPTLSYVWYFGDGPDSSTLINPTHTYSITGYHYNVTLKATNSLGCSSSLVRSGYVYADAPITAKFGYTQYYCNAPATEILNSSITTGGTAPFTYAWAFGDGSTYATVSPTYTVTHTYTVPAVYVPTLTVTDIYGCSKDTADYFIVSYPYAGFITNTAICIYTAGTFSNTSTVTLGSSPNTYVWLFGNGTTSVSGSPTVTYTYTAAGTYTVSLTTSNHNSCNDTVEQVITVYSEPVSSFTISPQFPCPAPTDVTFTSNVYSGSVVSWNFGDDSTGTGDTITHTYTYASLETSIEELIGGGYEYVSTYHPVTIKMIVTDSVGCKDTVSQADTIYDLHIQILAGNLSGYGCAHSTYHFGISAFTSSPYGHYAPYPDSAHYSYSWNFGDSTSGVLDTSTLANPIHYYTDSGSYTVTCTVVTANGCTAETSYVINIGTLNEISVTDSPGHICNGGTVYFTANTVFGNPKEYAWVWGDVTYDIYGDPVYYLLDSGINTASHTFETPGTYTVAVYSYNNNSCGFGTSVIVTVDSSKALIGISSVCNPDSAFVFL